MKQLVSIFFSILVFFTFSFAQQQIDFPIVSTWQNETGKNTVTALEQNYKVVIFNKSSNNSAYTLKIFDSEGNQLGYSTGSLSPDGNTSISLNSLVENNDSTISRVSLIGDNLLCLLVVWDEAGERLAAVWPPDVDATDTMWINHIAPERDQFFTSFSIYSKTDSNLTWTDNEKTESLTALKAGETTSFELSNIYSSVPDTVDIVSITAENSQIITGFESFGNWDDKKTLAILPTTSFKNTRLIFPHIAYSESLYWTGLAIGNPNTEENKIILRFMDESGNVIQTQYSHIDSLKRMVILFANENSSSPALAEQIPDGTAWLDVYGENPLSGFELFGGNDITKADYMEGIRATAEPFQLGVAPYFINETNQWTGIAIVNSLSIPIQVEMNLLSETGESLETINLDFNPFEKKVNLLSNVFSAENLQLGKSIVISSSEKGAIVGIIVFGDDSVEPRKLLGGYEIMPLNNNRQFRPQKGKSSLPKFGINFPKFVDIPGVTVPTQEALKNEFAWLSSGQTLRLATRQMQNRDVFYSEWTEENKENRDDFYFNKQGFVVMPTLIGFKAEWNGLGEPIDSVDMNNPEHVSRLESYVTDVINTYPNLDYFEILNETFGIDSLGMDNFAQILDTTIDTAKNINPDIKISFPHLLGTIPTILDSALNNLIQFSYRFPETLNKCDVYGLHYYGPWQQFGEIVEEKLIAPMTNNIIPDKPWVITETGISNSTADDTVTATNGIEGGFENQASYMIKMFTIAFSYGAEMSMLHSVQSGSTTGDWSGFGIIDKSGNRTLASCAYRFFTNAVSDFTCVDTLKNGEDEIWLYRYNNGKRLLGNSFVAWRGEEDEKSNTTLTLSTLAGQTVKITTLVPNNCYGSAGDFTRFDESQIFDSEIQTVGDDEKLTVSLGKYPILVQATETTINYKINIQSENSNGTVQNLLGTISGPLPTPETTGIDLTPQMQDVGITSVRNNDNYDDSLDIEGIFQCPDNTYYPSWECDATDEQFYFWEESDTTYSAIIGGGFEPFLRLGGESESHYNHHDFAGPQNELQENNWIIAAKKMVERYKNWSDQNNAFQYLDIWTEWPNTVFWDRSNNDFLNFWAKAFKAIKTSYPELKVGGPGILKPTVDVIAGLTNNNWAVSFLNKMYLEGVKPDWIGFHLWKNDPELYYKAANQFKDLLDGTGDFSSMIWSGTGFYKDVELICDAYGFGKSYDNEEGQPVDLSKEELFEIMNSKKGATILCSQLIAMQQGGIVRAYYYRTGDPESSPDVGPYDKKRGWTGLFYGDSLGTSKPSSNAFRLFAKLYHEFPNVLSTDFVSIGSTGEKIFYLASKNTEHNAIILANPSDKSANISLLVDNVNLLELSEKSIQVYQIDNENNGNTGVTWNGNYFHIPPNCTQLITW